MRDVMLQIISWSFLILGICIALWTFWGSLRKLGIGNDKKK